MRIFFNILGIAAFGCLCFYLGSFAACYSLNAFDPDAWKRWVAHCKAKRMKNSPLQ